MKTTKMALTASLFSAPASRVRPRRPTSIPLTFGATPLYLQDQPPARWRRSARRVLMGLDLHERLLVSYGEIYGIRIASNELRKIDPVTGTAAVAAMLNSPDDIVSLALDPTTGRLYGNTSVGFVVCRSKPCTKSTPGPATAHSSDGSCSTTSTCWASARAGSTGVANAPSPHELISISTASGNGSSQRCRLPASLTLPRALRMT